MLDLRLFWVPDMYKDSRIYIAGHKGMVGSAITRKLQQAGYNNLITADRSALDLMNTVAVRQFFQQERPDYVFLAAAKVGGILANIQAPAEFLYNNLLIQNNVIHSAYEYGVKKLEFLGSSCIYPKYSPQPIKEEYLLTGALEETNEWYAVAKISGIKMIQAYKKQYGFQGISLMPTNLYGPEDNFDLKTSHVLPALIRKFHEAKTSQAPSVQLWGTGTSKREFLHVDDFADAALHLMLHYDSEEIINVGVGKDIEIRKLALLIGDVVGYRGEINYDNTKPDGTPRKLLDVSRLTNTGWESNISLKRGIQNTYKWYLEHIK